MQLIIATPESPKEMQVLALPGPLQPPHPRPSMPKMHGAMEHSCITMDDLPNSWAEVSFDAVEQRIQHVAKVLRKPHLGVTLSANAFSHDQLLTGETLLSHPSVKAIFVSSIPRAIQLSSRVPRGKEVVLFSQPPMENLCQLGYSKVAILVESLQWLRMAKRQLRRCVFKTSKRRPVKIHLELDTGIGRSGLKGIFLAVHVVLKSPRMRLTGLSTKLCCSNDAAATARSLLYLRSREVLLHALLHGAGSPLFPLMLHVGGGLALKPQDVLQALQHFPSHWLVRVGEGIFHGSQSEEDLEITWKTTVSALRFLPDGYFGYCPQDMTSCDTRPAVPKTGSWVAVLPVGFAEFRGGHVFFADGVERKVLNSGASTTVVEAMKEEVDVGDVVTLCHRCSVYSVPWSIPRVTDLARREKHCWPIVQ